jgi:ABC-type branched-subunit amino acid transport system substrate-binding protein
LKKIAFVIGLAFAAGCSKGEDSYTVAAAGPWKEAYGVMSRRGIDLAVDEINRAGGINGAPL